VSLPEAWAPLVQRLKQQDLALLYVLEALQKAEACVAAGAAALSAAMARQQPVAGCAPLPAADMQHLAESFDVLAQLLMVVVPSRYCCNSLGCSSLACVSEGFALVRGSSCVCGGCKQAR
jgi:hypothetical protein